MTAQTDSSLVRLGEIDELGHEARGSAGDHAALRLWLRLLSCTTQIEEEIRKRLRARFGISWRVSTTSPSSTGSPAACG